ncbi:putative hypothetical protein [Streptomyces sp. NBRC 110611]|nr:putative hypothetical protein [Streptomyces sp. NBRC 110611]
MDLPAPLAPTRPVTPGAMSTESRSKAVTRGNRLLRLSVTITVTSSTVGPPGAPVVSPGGGIRLPLRYYGP